MDSSPARILVVCNPQDDAELTGVLAGDPLPVAGVPAEVATGDGGDDTVARFVELRPEVVVLTASLDAGDARALVAAMRGAAPAGSFHVVLVGDATGPIRNALDAADFGSDRFVARPVAPKALRYAVGSGVATARGGRAGGNGEVSAAPVTVMPEPSRTRARATTLGREAMVGRAATEAPRRAVSSRLDEMLDAAVEETTRDEVVRRTSAGFAIPIEAILAAGEQVEVTTPTSVHDLPTRPVSDPVVIHPRRAPRVEEPVDALGPGEESGSHELPPGVEAPVVSDTEGSFDDLAVVEPAASPPANDEDSWDAPMPVREPTLILTDGAPSPASGDVDVTERRPGGGWGRPSSVPAISSAEDGLGGSEGTPPPMRKDRDDEVEDHLDADLSDLSISRPVPVPAPPAGGDFARELRRKMSMMAQRLFRQTDAPPPAEVDARPPHDFRTEIDLAEIDAGARAAGTEVYDLSGDATFAGDDHGLPGAPTGAAEGTSTSAGSTRTAEAGDIVRGTSDAAVLIARMFLTEFTGRVVFRRDGIEKVIYIDGGRPVFASSNLAADRMGELLYREGKITADQYARCRDLVADSGRRMGEILVDRGFLKRRELLPAVRRHVEDIIYSLFAWEAGEYRIVSGDGASSERIRLSRHPAAMVLEGVRRKLDLPMLERLLGPATTVVEVGDRDKAGTVIAVADLSADERAALAAMDGSADLAHVARTTGALPVTIYQLAWAMTLLGVATVRRRGGDDDDAPALVGETDLAIDRERVCARHRLVAEADYFALLGVRRDATGFEIRRAYEAACRDFDAESFPPELRTELAVELAEIGAVLEEAYRVLRDDRLRGEYLAHLAD